MLTRPKHLTVSFMSLYVFHEVKDQSNLPICLMSTNEEIECCQQVIHIESCLLNWYESQQVRGLIPTCPFCRAEASSNVLEQVSNLPVRDTTTKSVPWPAADCFLYYWNYVWNNSIPTEQDEVFLGFLAVYLPNDVSFIGDEEREMYLARIH